MTQNLLIFGMRLEIYLTIICLADGSGVVVPTICQLRFQTQVYWIIVFGFKGINGLQREGWNARRIALSHFGCGNGIRNRQQAIRTVHSRTARCVAAECGVFENLLQAHASIN